MEHSLTPTRGRSLRVFLLGLFVAAAAFLPYLLYDKGYFFYYGDFNVQQIPFYQLAHQAIREGNFWWNWKTDLGANFIGSYSFYLFFSPFFWLTIPFPTSFLPHLMAPLLMLKSGCAALTAYWYLRRFVRDGDWAVFCALLYAFSGFSVYNIFFNHFHEAIVFFPLLLIGLEKAMTENKYGFFAAGIAVNAVVNYWFFIGEVIFVIFYFFCRLSSPQWRMTAKRFFLLAAEALLGMGMAMFAFLPSVLAILGNPRTTDGNLLLGGSLWYYSNPQRYLGIVHSFFFAPDMPALNNFFPDHGAQWASLSAYLPVVGAVGVLAYFFAAKKSWLKKILAVSAILALVPMGNHLFVLENYSYYARWYYMPTLMMVLATAIALENADKAKFAKAIRVTGGTIVLLLIISGLTPKRVDGVWKFGLYKYLEKFLTTGSLTLVFFLLTAFLLSHYRGEAQFKERFCSAILVGCFVFTFTMMLIGKATYSDNRWIVEKAIPGRGMMAMDPDGEFARSDIYKGSDNLGMYWDLPNIQCFHSVIPTSIMAFYPEVGVKRDVSSKPEAKYVHLRSLLSVKWLYIAEGEKEQAPMRGFTLVDNRLGYNIYQNQNYLPMGFSYDRYISEKDWEALPTDYKSRALLHGIYLEDEVAARHKDILRPVESDWQGGLAADELELDVADRSMMTCDSFVIDRKGFTATANFGRERLLFFSVPWDKGWTATVNGEPARIEKANIGFMAVRVPAGEAVIRFDYLTPGLVPGAVCSLVSLALLLVFLFLAGRGQPCPLPSRDYDPAFYLERPQRPRFLPGEFEERLEDKPPAVTEETEVPGEEPPREEESPQAEAPTGEEPPAERETETERTDER